nr:hypothetical protein [Tanacetum cinerariifolium]
NRGNSYQAPIQHPQVEPTNEFSTYKKITETSIRAMQNQITNLKAEMKNEIRSSIQNQINNVKNELKSDINTIANPRGDLKAITTRSGVSYDEPPIPHPFSSLPKVVERVPESKVRNSKNKPIVSQVKPSNVDSLEIASAVASVVTSAMTAMFKQHQVTPAPASVKAVEESCVTCGEIASAVASVMTAMFKQHQVTPAPASVKAVEESCVTYGGAHSYRQCPATDGNTFSGFAQPNVQNQGFNQNRGNNFTQGNTSYQAPIQQTQVVTSSDLEKFKKTNEANMQSMRNHISNLKSKLRSKMQSTMQNQNNAFKNELTNDIKNMIASFFQMNTASTLGSGPLPSNTIANLKGELKAITTRSGIVLDGPSVLMPPPFINPEED